MKILRWIADYWYVPLLLVGVVLGLLFFWKRGKVPPLEGLTKELKAIEAKREARDIQLQLGAEQAKQHVAEKYAEKRKTLDDEAEAKAKELEHDPVALALYLERLTRG